MYCIFDNSMIHLGGEGENIVIVSVTERGTYKRCRRRWDLSSEYRQALQPVGAGAPALELGSLIHKALASWILDPNTPPEHFFMVEAQNRIEYIEADVLARTGREAGDEELASILESVELGRAMMSNYAKRWKTPVPDNMVFAAAEQSIVVPVPGTEHPCVSCVAYLKVHRSSPLSKCKSCNGTGVQYHYLSGTLDGLLRSDKDELFVLEHKTFSRRPDVRQLQLTDQFTAYLWMLRQLNIGRVGGVAYDGMWKRPSPPRGKEFKDLFVRTVIRKAKPELDEFGAMLAAELNEMAQPNLPLYTNRRWEGCGDCGFEILCEAMSKGDDVDWIREKYYTSRIDNKVRGLREEVRNPDVEANVHA